MGKFIYCVRGGLIIDDDDDHSYGGCGYDLNGENSCKDVSVSISISLSVFVVVFVSASAPRPYIF